MAFKCTAVVVPSGATAAVLAGPARWATARSSRPAPQRQLWIPAAKGSANGSVSELATVTFEMERHVDFGDEVCVVGDAEALGNWDPDKCLAMEWTEGDSWTVKVDLPVKETIEYKYIVKRQSGEEVEWQPGENEVHNVGLPGTDSKVIDEWQRREEAGEEMGTEEATQEPVAVGEVVEEAKTGGVDAGIQEDAAVGKYPGAEEQDKGLAGSTAARGEDIASESAKPANKPADKLAPEKTGSSTVERVI